MSDGTVYRPKTSYWLPEQIYSITNLGSYLYYGLYLINVLTRTGVTRNRRSSLIIGGIKIAESETTKHDCSTIYSSGPLWMYRPEIHNTTELAVQRPCCSTEDCYSQFTTHAPIPFMNSGHVSLVWLVGNRRHPENGCVVEGRDILMVTVFSSDRIPNFILMIFPPPHKS